MLQSFRHRLTAVFLTAIMIFLLSSLGMLTFYIVPIDSQSWAPTVRGMLREYNALAASFLRQRVPELGNAMSLSGQVVQEHVGIIEGIADFIQLNNKNLSYQTALRVASALKYYSSKYGVPIDLVVAVTYTESRFDPSAKSKYGASGIMQVVWRMHSDLLTANGITSEAVLFEPELGAAAGCLLLSRYIRNSSTLQLALGKYYGGDSGIYWSRISKAMKRYQAHIKK